MTAVPDPCILILLIKEQSLQLLKGVYGRLIVPMSMIKEISPEALDGPINEGWLELRDPDINYLMKVDKIQSKSGLKLSVNEEAGLALALQNRDCVVVTNDRVIVSVATLLEINTESIPKAIVNACKLGIMSKKDGFRLFDQIYEDFLPGLRVYEMFQDTD